MSEALTRLPGRNIIKLSVLIIITPFLTELLTYNLPPAEFFKPATFVFLLVFYGFPAVLIREFSVINKTGIQGIFLMGLGYGILNEGILAETLFMTEGVPMGETFGEYPLLLGLNLGFTVFIICWHAMHSVLYPVLVSRFIFPGSAGRRWLNTPATIILTAITAGGGIFFHLNNRHDNPLYYSVIFFAVIVVLVLLSAKLRKKPDSKPRKAGVRLFFFGFLFLSLFFFGQSVIAAAGLPFPVSMLFSAVIVTVIFLLLKIRGYTGDDSLLLFGTGSYFMHTMLLVVLGIIQRETDRLITGVVLSAALFILAGSVYKKNTRKYSTEL